MRARLLPVLMSFTFVIACAEDLTAVTALWSGLQSTWTTFIDEAKKTGAAAAASAAELKVANGDEAGAALKAKVDSALGDHSKAVAELEGVLANTKAGVEKGIADKKIAPVQKAIDDGKAAWATAAGKLPDLTTAATSAIDALKQHIASAAKPAAREEDESTDEVAVKKKGAVVTFNVSFQKDDTIGDAENTSIMKRFLKFMNTCPVIKVELTGKADTAARGKTRAQMAKTYVEKRGVPASRVARIDGKAGGNGLTATIVNPCP
jgi:hypothetical protein